MRLVRRVKTSLNFRDRKGFMMSLRQPRVREASVAVRSQVKLSLRLVSLRPIAFVESLR